MRGLTLTNTCVILDEAQNTLPIQIKTFLTRIGQGSKFIVNGDLLQTDIHHENGLEDSIKRLVGVRGLGMSRFTSEDIVRHHIETMFYHDIQMIGKYHTNQLSQQCLITLRMDKRLPKVRDKINKYYN